MMRSSGVLMSLTSLASPYGVGTMGAQARAFVDFLHDAGQSWWQLLPTGPTGYGDSPYQSFSTFAGNPYLIDLDELAGEGLLEPEEYRDLNWGDDPAEVDYGLLYRQRFPVLRLAVERLLAEAPEDYTVFLATNGTWLPDYALFMALKNANGGDPWWQWPKPLRFRQPTALAAARRELSGEIAFWQGLQYLFFHQWRALKKYANDLGVRFIGDLPIYVARDSADVWARPDQFQLDEELLPVEVAGVPPDAFTADGQLWGNPLYNWAKMKADGYGWWIRRVESAGQLFDAIRIDHFRAMASYWSVPAGAATAKEGRWEAGPGMSLVGVLTSWFPHLHFIAEDLGILTPDVTQLLQDSGLPGMKVLEFAFSGPDNAYLPHNCKPHCVLYTGTHDNAPAALWSRTASESELAYAQRYLGVSAPEELPAALLRAGHTSVADTFIAQLQDYLEVEGRINVPGTAEGNWSWRLAPGTLTDALADRIHTLTHDAGRCPPRQEPPENA